jgi:hypothetical protein
MPLLHSPLFCLLKTYTFERLMGERRHAVIAFSASTPITDAFEVIPGEMLRCAQNDKWLGI